MLMLVFPTSAIVVSTAPPFGIYYSSGKPNAPRLRSSTLLLGMGAEDIRCSTLQGLFGRMSRVDRFVGIQVRTSLWAPHSSWHPFVVTRPAQTRGETGEFRAFSPS